jgi:hypothetical protein
VGISQTERAREPREAAARAHIRLGDAPGSGLELARGVLVAIVLSIPLWAMIVAVVVAIVSTQ